MLFIDGKLLRDAKGPSSGDDGDLVDGIASRDHLGHEGMSCLVVGRVLPLLQRDDHRFTFHPHEDLVLRLLEIAHLNLVLLLSCGEKGRFVYQVFEIGTGESRCASGNQG